MVQAGNIVRPSPRDVTCTHCGKYGHDINDCFQIKGYSDRWGERGRNFGEERGRGFNNRGGIHGRFGRGGGVVGSYGRLRGLSSHGRVNATQMHPATNVVAAAAHTTRKEDEYDQSAIPQLSNEQWTAVINFLQNTKGGTTEKLSGKKDNPKFITDTDASHHMTWNLDFLSDITDIVPCSIGLPDGDIAVATKQGNLCLGSDLWLRGVLYSSELTCSLLYVAKLLKVINGSITFPSDLCVL